MSRAQTRDDVYVGQTNMKFISHLTALDLPTSLRRRLGSYDQQAQGYWIDKTTGEYIEYLLIKDTK